MELVVKNTSANAGEAGGLGLVQSLGHKDPLEEEMATHSSVLAPVSVGRGVWQTIVPGVTSWTRLN